MTHQQQNDSQPPVAPKKGTQRTVLKLVIIPILMFGFGFAMVPMYNVLCKATGLNGKTGGPTAYNPHPYIDTNRTVTVQFMATNNANLPWSFYPLQKSIHLHLGENVVVAYFARNNTDKTMTVQAIPSISPGLAASHVKKTECFCFTQQTFKAGESRRMPILFHVDTDLPQEMTTLTLSYTLFDISRYGVKKQAQAGHL